MKQIPEVIGCRVTGATSVRLKFRDGLAATLDLSRILTGPIFAPLKSPDRFREVLIQDGTLVWPNGADICPSVLYYWCELGRVCSQEELDTHFVPLTSAVGVVAELPGKYTAKRKR
jgi:hypothetical protein